MASSANNQSAMKTNIIWMFKVMKLIFAILELAWGCVKHRVHFWYDKEKKKKLIAYINEAAHMKESLLKPEDWQDTLFTWPMFKQDCRMLYLDLYKDVHLHGQAQNVKLSTLDMTECNLFDFAKHDRPLVVNFGSCT